MTPQIDIAAGNSKDGNERVLLGVLEAIERDHSVTQRGISSGLGIALGLTNLYLRRCVRKGLVKVSQVPRGRVAYYLTPLGFTEKSRLTARYLAYSFSLFRQARIECAELFAAAEKLGWRRVAIWGSGDLAEIAVLCSIESPVKIVAMIDPSKRSRTVAGIACSAALDLDVDGIMVADIEDVQGAFDAATAAVGAERVLAPPLLRVRLENARAAVASVRDDQAPTSTGAQ
jgi:hypothetical protein